LSSEKLSIADLVAESGSRVLAFIARYTSYVFAVSIFSAGFSGAVSTVFTLYYFDAVNVSVSETFMFILKALIFTYWIILMIQHGLLGRFGIPGFGLHIKTVNRYVKSNPSIEISKDLSEEEYKELFKSIVALPGFLAFNLFIWVFVLILIAMMLGIFLEGFNGSVIFSLLTIDIICLYDTVCITLIASEIMTGSIREKCKEIMNSKGIQFRDRALSTVLTKFILFLILLAIALYLSNVVTYYNHDHIEKVISFSILALVVSCLLAYMIFRIIYNALKQIESAAYDLMRGGSGLIFPRSLDKEFINVAIGLNKASKTINDYKISLEEKVQKRTSELNAANNELIAKGQIAEQELELARNIQQGIIPSDLKTWNGISFAAYYEPMGKVSGDYYDVFYFSKKIFVLMADVSGHGVPAAMITMAAKQAFLQVIQEEKKPADIFKEVNQIILDQVKTSDYLSAFLLRIDEKNRLTYGNAAHPQAIHYIHSREEYQLLDTEGMFIGAVEEASDFYANSELKLQSGDRIYLYTDGVLEHKNTSGEQYGMDRFIETLSRNRNQSLSIQINEVISSLKKFMGNAPIRDDISIIAIELDPNWAKFIDLFNQGLKNLREKKLEEALAQFLNALKIVPTFLAIQFHLAAIHFHLGDLDKSLEHILVYLKDNPLDKKAIQLIINIYSNQGNEKEMNKWLTQFNNIH